MTKLDRDRKPPSAPVKKPSNADGLSAGALEAALERARMRFALDSEDAHDGS